MSMLLRGIKRDKQIYEDWIAGEKLVDLATKYGYRGASGVSSHITNYEDLLLLVGAPIPKREPQFYVRRKKPRQFNITGQ